LTSLISSLAPPGSATTKAGGCGALLAPCPPPAPADASSRPDPSAWLGGSAATNPPRSSN
jgi:hypothetical protein